MEQELRNELVCFEAPTRTARLYCPRCGRGMFDEPAGLCCSQGSMCLDDLQAGPFLERFPELSERPFGIWPEGGIENYHCPGCGVALPADLTCEFCGRTIADLVGLIQDHQDTRLLKRGERWRSLEHVEGFVCHVPWGEQFMMYAPSFPAGEVLKIAEDQDVFTPSVRCRVVRRRVLNDIVPLKFRLQLWRYRGYGLWIPASKLRQCFERVQ